MGNQNLAPEQAAIRIGSHVVTLSRYPADMISRRSFLQSSGGPLAMAVMPGPAHALVLCLDKTATHQPAALLTPAKLDREVLWYATRCCYCASENGILSPRGRHLDGGPFMTCCEFCKWHVTDPVLQIMPEDFSPGPGWKFWPMLVLLNDLGLLYSARSA